MAGDCARVDYTNLCERRADRQLFREEAVRHATRRLTGEVTLAVPLSTTALSLFGVGILVVALSFVSFASYPRRESVAGWLTPESGMSRAIAVREGIVEELFLTEGGSVQQGQSIANVRISYDVGGGDATQAVLNVIDDQAALAVRAAELEVQLLHDEQRRLSGLVDGYRAELRDLRDQLTLQIERVRSSEASYERSQAIARNGHLAEQDLESRRNDVLEASSIAAALRREVSSTERQLQDTQNQLSAIPTRIAVAETDAASISARLTERATSTAIEGSYVVTSRWDGLIAALPVHQGEDVRAGTTIAVIVPEGESIIAELFIPSRAAGFVEVGQDVRLLYQAYPHQRFGHGDLRPSGPSFITRV